MWKNLSSEATEQTCDSCKRVEVVYARDKDASNYPLPQKWALVKFFGAYKNKPDTIKLLCPVCYNCFTLGDHIDENGNLTAPLSLYHSQLLNYEGLYPTKR